MKHLKTFGLIALIALVALGITACGFQGDSLVGTEWRNSTAGTGVGLKFTSATVGTSTLGVFGVWGDVSAFTYTYVPASKTGTITYDGSTTANSFSISGQELTMGVLTYKFVQ
jgi:hypothetical protein